MELYHPFFWTELVPRLSDHFGELTLSIWVERLEFVMLFGKEEVVATSVRLRMAGVTRSSASPPLPSMVVLVAVFVGDNGTAVLGS